MPNTGRRGAASLDANYFQHTPYLEELQRRERHPSGQRWRDPLRAHAASTRARAATWRTSPDGATIAVPNDTTNEARALQLLAAQGIMTVRRTALGLSATVQRHRGEPPQREDRGDRGRPAARAPALTWTSPSSTATTHCERRHLRDTDALATEDAASEAAQTYANVRGREGRQRERPRRAGPGALALTSDTIKDFINNTYDGAVVPIF